MTVVLGYVKTDEGRAALATALDLLQEGERLVLQQHVGCDVAGDGDGGPGHGTNVGRRSFDHSSLVERRDVFKRQLSTVEVWVRIR